MASINLHIIQSIQIFDKSSYQNHNFSWKQEKTSQFIDTTYYNKTKYCIDKQ